jgi:apolipoprotein D and lipocalin family protein
MRLALTTLAIAALLASAAAAAPLDAAHYSGTWLEVGRTPSRLTDGCVAGTTTYTRADTTHVSIVDDCRKGGVDGPRKAITGKGTILDPGNDHQMGVRYLLVINWRFDVLEHDPAGQWFITGDPQKKRIFIYTRKAPSPALLADLVNKARGTGYAGPIELPKQP